MQRYLAYLAYAISAAALAAQPIPGRYIVEFTTAPAATLAVGRPNLASAAGLAAARRTQIQADHAALEPAIRALGGRVTHHYDTVFNGMAVDIADTAAPQLNRLPGVRAVYPDMRHRLNLDHAVNVHQITQAWQSLAGGMPSAGAGIKIGMLDSGIDINHPGFQGFSTAIPAGFPILSDPTQAAFSNNKVIVVRDYSGSGGLDAVVGHGTGTAMVAAGVTNNPGLPSIGPITGAAPGAWLGNYRVIDDTGGGQTSWFLAALNDALNDGMNVVNYSAGNSDLSANAENGPAARAIASAVAAGMVVVVAAGNNGPEPGNISDPAVAPAAITVGANENERFFDFAVTLGTLPPYDAAVPPSEQGVITSASISGPLIDVTALDGTGLGCAAFPNGSLTGQIALISRGTCNFDNKLNNAQNAGAVGAVVYDNQVEGLVLMSLNTATLPATFVSQASGQAMLKQVAASLGLVAVIDFTGFVPLAQSSDLLAPFSSAGPTPGGGLKPDLVAVGDWILTADTTTDGNNPGPPYLIWSGTSFSTPLVTGSVAVLMGARPGLTAAQYRSLVINSAPQLLNPDTTPVTPQTAGSGKLNLLQALQNNLTATPSSVDFLSAAGAVNATIPVSFTNSGSAPDTFTVVVNAINTTGPVPSLDVPTFTLAPGASQTVKVSLSGSSLPTGQYHGFLAVTGSQTSVATRVPYWFAVPGTAVQYLSLQTEDNPGPYSTGDTVSLIVRSLDAVGLPLEAGPPQVTVTGVRPRTTITASPNIPGTYQVNVRVGGADANGLNSVTLTLGNASREIDLAVE